MSKEYALDSNGESMIKGTEIKWKPGKVSSVIIDKFSFTILYNSDARISRKASDDSIVQLTPPTTSHDVCVVWIR